MRRRLLELVVIKWIDSETEDGWGELAPAEPFSENMSVGYLVSQEPDRYVLAADYDQESDHFNRVIRIPRCCVTKLKTITYVPLRKRRDA